MYILFTFLYYILILTQHCNPTACHSYMLKLFDFVFPNNKLSRFCPIELTFCFFLECNGAFDRHGNGPCSAVIWQCYQKFQEPILQHKTVVGFRKPHGRELSSASSK